MSCSSKSAAKFLLIRVPIYRKGTTIIVMRIRPNGVWKTKVNETRELIKLKSY